MGQFTMHSLRVMSGLTVPVLLGLPSAAWANPSTPLPPLAVTTAAEALATPAVERGPAPLEPALDAVDAVGVDAVAVDGVPNRLQFAAEANSLAAISLDFPSLDPSAYPWATPDETTFTGATLRALEPLSLDRSNVSTSIPPSWGTTLRETTLPGGLTSPVNLGQAAEPAPPSEPLEPSGPLDPSSPLEPSEPLSPWRIEFRPYLQVPFAINGQLLFESFVDGGSGGGIGGGGIGGGGVGGIGGGGGILDPGGTLNLDLGLGLDLSSIFLLGGELEVWYNDLGLYLDGFYADLGSRVLAGNTSNLQETPLQLGADYTRIGASLGWRAGRFPLASREGVPPAEVFPAVTVDLFGGARYSSYGFDATLTNSQRTFRLNPNWIEPTLMARAEFLFNTRTKLVLNGSVGGFGVGNAPSFSWGGYAGLDWRFLPNVSIRPSYQFSSIDWNGNLGSITLQTQAIWLGFSLYF